MLPLLFIFDVGRAQLYASGRYEIKARVPRAQGLVWGVYTYHYENHWDADHLPAGEVDSQFVPRASGWITKNNHEIDIEIPANCRPLCGDPKGNGCAGRWDTANLVQL